MALDHEAIRKAYSNAVTIDDSRGAFDKDGNSITLVQSNIDTARTELNTAAAAVKYKENREKESFEESGVLAERSQHSLNCKRRNEPNNSLGQVYK